MDDNQNSMTAGEFGPILLQDFHLIDKLAHFDRERIPERVVHAKGAGAHGFFGKKGRVSTRQMTSRFITIGLRTVDCGGKICDSDKRQLTHVAVVFVIPCVSDVNDLMWHLRL